MIVSVVCDLLVTAHLPFPLSVAQIITGKRRVKWTRDTNSYTAIKAAATQEINK